VNLSYEHQNDGVGLKKWYMYFKDTGTNVYVFYVDLVYYPLARPQMNWSSHRVEFVCDTTSTKGITTEYRLEITDILITSHDKAGGLIKH